MGEPRQFKTEWLFYPQTNLLIFDTVLVESSPLGALRLLLDISADG